MINFIYRDAFRYTYFLLFFSPSEASETSTSVAQTKLDKILRRSALSLFLFRTFVRV